jgi:hypothetical protein
MATGLPLMSTHVIGATPLCESRDSIAWTQWQQQQKQQRQQQMRDSTVKTQCSYLH